MLEFKDFQDSLIYRAKNYGDSTSNIAYGSESVNWETSKEEKGKEQPFAILGHTIVNLINIASITGDVPVIGITGDGAKLRIDENKNLIIDQLENASITHKINTKDIISIGNQGQLIFPSINNSDSSLKINGNTLVSSNEYGSSLELYKYDNNVFRNKLLIYRDSNTLNINRADTDNILPANTNNLVTLNINSDDIKLTVKGKLEADKELILNGISGSTYGNQPIQIRGGNILGIANTPNGVIEVKINNTSLGYLQVYNNVQI